MTDYTPTTEEVRERYANDEWDVENEAVARLADFNRWLEEHDRQVAEEAYDEGFANGVDYHEDTIYAPLNPYRNRKAES